MQTYVLPQMADADGPGEERLERLLRDLPIEIRQAGLLLVVRTLPGSAHAIAAALDRTGWREPVGSIAGDDTLFIAFAERASLERIRRRLLRMVRI
jgi:transcriptional regulator of arginine metabolism